MQTPNTEMLSSAPSAQEWGPPEVPSEWTNTLGPHKGGVHLDGCTKCLYYRGILQNAAFKMGVSALFKTFNDVNPHFEIFYFLNVIMPYPLIWNSTRWKPRPIYISFVQIHVFFLSFFFVLWGASTEWFFISLMQFLTLIWVVPISDWQNQKFFYSVQSNSGPTHLIEIHWKPQKKNGGAIILIRMNLVGQTSDASKLPVWKVFSLQEWIFQGIKLVSEY